jgi:hypothetical protein
MQLSATVNVLTLLTITPPQNKSKNPKNLKCLLFQIELKHSSNLSAIKKPTQMPKKPLPWIQPTRKVSPDVARLPIIYTTTSKQRETS